MKIGLFDSGIGGLTVFNEIVKLLPQYDYRYFGDNARAPYGNRTQEEIYEFTRQGVAWLFKEGALIVILACNTASSQALRKLQQEWLPIEFPERKILGVIIPIVEEAAHSSKGSIGIIGTRATVASRAYIRELRKVRHDLQIIQVAIPEVVPLIERAASQDELKRVLEIPLLPLKDAHIDTLILGCTHYSLLYPLFKKMMGDEVSIPNINEIIAQKLASYLQKHPEIEKQLTKNGTQQFFTTGNPKQFSTLSKRFFGRKITAENVSLNYLELRNYRRSA